MQEMKLNKWGDFVDLIVSALDVDVGVSTQLPYVFRGQSDEMLPLQPTLLRYLTVAEATEQESLKIESVALEEFKSQAHLHVLPNEHPPANELLDWWAMMQHYGAPTRLLDWTYSIYVAAYFAVNKLDNKDGVIWVVHLLTVLEVMKSKFDDAEIPSASVGREAILKKAGNPPNVTFSRPARKSQRIAVQQGIFSLSFNVLGDHGKILEEAFPSGLVDGKPVFVKLVIPASLKREFSRKLRAMNITANSLFPGLDGMGRSVDELVRLGLNK